MSEEAPIEEVNIKENNPEVDEEEEENVLTLNEVLEIENDFIENAAAVLGAANDKVCSYTEGYLKRQALYSCLTCIPEAKEDPEKGAGVCLACCYHCHDGHDLVELYTKRNFRCDCGNSKFTNLQCNLYHEKNDKNDLNSYNQNFSGLYCVCHRPYPDMEDPVPDEMIQCIICEDWYHTRHLGTEVPSNNFAEMICEACITKHEFLLHYDDLSIFKVAKTSEEETVDVTSEKNEETVNEDDSNKKTENTSNCKKPKEKSSKISAKFWPEVSWRKELCTCDECLKMYETEDVAFLLDSEDPVHLYEEKGKAKTQEIIDNHDKNFLDSMNRVQAIEFAAGYNDFKEQFKDFVGKFIEKKEVMKVEDVKEFFDEMYARKRRKLDVVVPTYCR